MFLWKIFRRFFMAIDIVLYNCISSLYETLMAISRTSILSQGDIVEFAGRIQLLLGIFMLFKISFSLITFIVNPDDFSDKSKGFGKLVQNAVISLLMLIIVPYIFNMAYTLQAKVLESNILGKIIFADRSDDGTGTMGSENYIYSAGEEMAFQLMLPFFKPNTGVSTGSSNTDLSDCINIYDGDKFNKDCKKALEDAGMGNINLENYVVGIEKRSLGLTFRVDAAVETVGSDADEKFLIDYMSPISTVVAVVACLLLVSFCIDIGLRSVKLAFLQLIYPIPVIGYMDPKGGKDGIFKKWYQMCISTYLSLFVRLLALYFGVYIISKLGDGGMYDVINGSQVAFGWITIFVIIGVLMFVKQLPKILENLGIKLDGDGKFTLNPLKKLEDGMIGGKTISKAAKGAAIGAGGAALVGGASMLTGKGFHGTTRAMKNAITGGFKGEKFGKNISNSYGAGAARKKEVEKMRNAGTGPMAVGWENFKNNFVGMTAKDKYDDFTSSVKAVQDNYKSFYGSATGVDQIAKELDRQKKLADSRGDHTASKAYDDALKDRLKEIQDNAIQGRASVIKTGANLAGITYDATTGTVDYVTAKAGTSLEMDKGINSTLQNTEKIINHIDNTYDGHYDYEKGDIGNLRTDKFTIINGKSSGATTAAAQSDEAKKISDRYQFVKNDSKK